MQKLSARIMDSLASISESILAGTGSRSITPVLLRPAILFRRIPARRSAPAGNGTMYDDKATKPSAACDYRCPSSRALSVLARQPKREWCLPPAIGNAGSIKPYPSVFVPLLLPRADSADVIFPQYLVQAH